MIRHTDQKGRPAQPITRRGLLIKGGVTLSGTSLIGFPFHLKAQTATSDLKRPGITSKDGGMKPTFLPESDSQDPVAHSVAENLFWNEQLMEHALFFPMMMPGPDLATQRSQAEQFKNTFEASLLSVRWLICDEIYHRRCEPPNREVELD